MTATAQLETTERSRSAYHEAGHFVVALALDSPALRVRALHIHESDRHTGAVITDSDGIFSWHDAREVCTILLAGFHAESRFSGTPMIEAATTDLIQAEELIRELSGSPHHWTTHALEISDRARRLVAMYWPAIDALARELLATSVLMSAEPARSQRSILLPSTEDHALAAKSGRDSRQRCHAPESPHRLRAADAARGQRAI